ncbi:hypothetical protein Pmani_025906 [Petrolisthes manimaculis]|uniref:Pentraxin (PTX) domain-containing protein n=1 Tax=Petrolisthes manimaculis TaxID=1843537 RepID=A0AAE1P4K8_9EUCA|nr:hypothetical protein Pmani_025906 [Petrolisthes manimaculis]
MLLVLLVVCVCVSGRQPPPPPPPTAGYQLVIEDEGGYARIMSPPPSLSSFTLSAWVNVTSFPDGVAPILTVVSPDATTQTAFFLRHDGLGVLWGGPTGGPANKVDQVDRHPRTQWTPGQARMKRDAADYSGGLGDIVNILADSRTGRSFDTWTPYGFVDVDQMGVTDLEASPSSSSSSSSSIQDSLHLLPIREGFSRSESYNDWTNVPYELAMLESDQYDHHLTHQQQPPPSSKEHHQIKPEPRIITEPSGDDDFVFFNWNVPSPSPKQTIPESPNQWSPMWFPNRESPPKYTTEQTYRSPGSATSDEHKHNSPGSVTSSEQTYRSPGSATSNEQTYSSPESATSNEQTYSSLGSATSNEQTYSSLGSATSNEQTYSSPESAASSEQAAPLSDSGSWLSQVTEVKLEHSGWRPQNLRPSITVVNPPKPAVKPAYTTTNQPSTTTTTTTTTQRPRTEYITTQAATRGKPTTTAPKRTHVLAERRKYVPAASSVVLAKVTSAPYKTPPTTSAAVPLKTTSTSHKTTSTPRTTTSAAPLGNARTTPAPPNKAPRLPTRRQPTAAVSGTQVSRSPAGSRKDLPLRRTASLSSPVTRMPLWKLIKNPGMVQHHHQHHHNKTLPNTIKTTPRTTTTTTTPTTTTAPTSPPPPPPLSTTTTTTTTTSRPTSQSITTRLSPTNQPTVHSYPQDLLTDKPQITGQKSKVSIWTSSGAIEKQRKNPTYHHHHDKNQNKQQQQQQQQQQRREGLLNAVNKHRAVEIMPSHVDEFHRAMNRVPLVKDGDTAVVYSIPITNVEAFNAMYQYYQKQETFTASSTPAAVVHASKEEEANENRLTSTSSSTLHDGLTRQYTQGTTRAELEKTQAPGIIREAEAVLPPTEDPLPPTPARSDIPVSGEHNGGDIKGLVTILSSSHQHQAGTQLAHDILQARISTATEKTDPSLASTKTRHTIPDFMFPSSKSPVIITEEPKLIPPPVSHKQNNEPTSYSSTQQNASPPTAPIEDNTREESSLLEGENILLLPKPLHLKLAHTLTQPPAVHDSHTTQSHTRVNLHSKKATSSSYGIFQDNDKKEQEKEEEKDIVVESDDDDAVFSIDELYPVGGELVRDEDDGGVGTVVHYQAPAHLYHEQLPPHYLTHLDLPRPISLHDHQQRREGVVYSADPQELIKQGFLPQPVHYVSTPEEAHEWMQEQYSSRERPEDRVYTVSAGKTVNKTPQPSIIKPQVKGQHNFNFKKLPYEFQANQWYHVAFTWSSSDHQTSVFVNGELVGTLTNVLLDQTVLTGGGLTVIGQTLLPDLTDFDATSQLVGQISDVNMWGERLREEAIGALYTCRGEVQLTPALSWHQLSMRFYSNVYIQKQSQALCGA